MNAKEAAWYFTQYCNYQFDDDAIAWMLPLFEKICAEVDIDFGNINDNINEVIHENLHKIAENPSVLKFLEDADWEEEALREYLEAEHDEYIIGTYDDFYDMLGISEGVRKNQYLFEAIYNELSPNDDSYYELNGYANGFNEVDFDDYKSDAISSGDVDSEEDWDNLEDYEKADIVRGWNYDIDTGCGWWEYMECCNEGGHGDIETQIANLIELDRETSGFGAHDLIYLDNCSGGYYSEDDIREMHLTEALRWKLEQELA